MFANDWQSCKKVLWPLKQCSYKSPTCTFLMFCFVMSYSRFQKVCKANARRNTRLVSKTSQWYTQFTEQKTQHPNCNSDRRERENSAAPYTYRQVTRLQSKIMMKSTCFSRIFTSDFQFSFSSCIILNNTEKYPNTFFSDYENCCFMNLNCQKLHWRTALPEPLGHLRLQDEVMVVGFFPNLNFQNLPFPCSPFSSQH